MVTMEMPFNYGSVIFYVPEVTVPACAIPGLLHACCGITLSSCHHWAWTRWLSEHFPLSTCHPTLSLGQVYFCFHVMVGISGSSRGFRPFLWPLSRPFLGCLWVPAIPAKLVVKVHDNVWSYYFAFSSSLFLLLVCFLCWYFIPLKQELFTIGSSGWVVKYWLESSYNCSKSFTYCGRFDGDYYLCVEKDGSFHRNVHSKWNFLISCKNFLTNIIC